MTKFESPPTSNPYPLNEDRDRTPRDSDSEEEAPRKFNYKPQLVRLREERARPGGGGPADIVFGIDVFDPAINGHEPYTEALHEKIVAGEVIVNGEPLELEDLKKPMSEVFPGLDASTIEEHLESILGDIEPKRPSKS